MLAALKFDADLGSTAKLHPTGVTAEMVFAMIVVYCVSFY